MSNPFPSLHNADSLLLDTNVIVNFSRVAPGGVALDYLITDTTTTYVTFRVEQEVLDNREMSGQMQASFQQWVYRNFNKSVQLVNTETPPGRNSGEQSIRELLADFGEYLGRSIVATGDYEEEFPGSSGTLDSAGLTNSLLLSGDISYVEYGALTARLATIAPREFLGDVMLVPTSKNTAYEVINPETGVSTIIEIRPNGLLVNGESVGFHQTFDIDPVTGEVTVGEDSPNIINDKCFLAGTMIEMWPVDEFLSQNTDGTYDEEQLRELIWEKPVENVIKGDVVVSYDRYGRLTPGTVTRTFVNNVKHILDFWGVGITPGHITLCGEGQFEHQHVPIIDIIRTDGAITRSDGILVRASTGQVVGSAADQFVHVVVGITGSDGQVIIREHGQLRLGMRIILSDGSDVALIDLIEANDGSLTDDGYVVDTHGNKLPLLWTHSDSLPRPEDYILQRSNLNLKAIYGAGEWEGIGTQLSGPAVSKNVKDVTANVPPAFADHIDAPHSSVKVWIN